MPKSKPDPCDQHLLYAAGKGDMAAACHALAHGGSVNARDKRDATPLIWAAMRGHVQVFQLLLSRGADLQARDENGHTALEYAAANGHAAIVDMLLERGGEPQTALSSAARGGQTALFEDLLVRGYAMPPLKLYDAISSGSRAAVEAALQRGEKADQSTSGGWTMLMEAANRGHTAIVALLLEKGANPSAWEARDGLTALYVARNPEIKELLKKAGAAF